MSLKLTLGIASFLLSVFAIFLNVLIFIPIFHLAFISKKSSIYVIAFFNILSDLLQVSTTCVFLSVAMIVDRCLIVNTRINHLSLFIGFIFLTAWFLECLVQIAMALNRLAVLTFNKLNIFTFKTTLLYFCFAISTTVISAICSQYVFPCCVFILDQNLMTFLYVDVDGIYSYSNTMVVSYNIVCTSTSILCYTTVFISIRKSRKATASNAQMNRFHQDIRYLLQFVLISIFYIFAWTLFETLPKLVPQDQTEWFSVVPVLAVLNCTSNAIIYLSSNQEVQKGLPIPWLRAKLTAGKVSGNAKVVQVSPANN